MADIKAALVEFLKASGEVQALCGDGRGGARVYPEAVPMKAGYPRVTLRQDGKDMPRAMSGASRQPVTRLTFEVHGQGRTGYADAQNLAQAVLDATGGVTGGPRLEDFGAAWMGTASRTWVKSVRFEDVTSEPPEDAPGGEQERIHALSLACVIHWNEVDFS